MKSSLSTHLCLSQKHIQMDVDRTTWGSTLVKNHDENKTYILVKLSESCSNAIQEYSAPKIKFHGTRGAIKFPNGKSYDFSLEQSDNPVECIKQTKSRWESVGKMAYCLHVKGKDDVYQRTRTKMEAAEQEKRKNCTKLLGSPDSETTATTTKATIANKSSSASSYYSSSTHNNNMNHSATSRAKSHLDNHTANNHKSSTITPTLAPASLLSSSSLASTVQATTATDIKSSILSSISSASSSSSSASSSSAAPTTNATNNNINSYNNKDCFNSSKYPDVTDAKQLKRYKAEFDRDFKEYQHLHGYLRRIEERFIKLRDLLNQRVEGSPEWDSAKEQIFNEYEKLNGDSNFHKARSKYNQLIRKLAHIKEKIFQYKRERRDKYNSRKKRKR